MGRKARPGNQNDLARKMGVSRQRVSALKQKGKLGADHDATLRMHQQRLAAQQRSPERRVKDLYAAKMAKLEYEREAKSLVEIVRVQREWKRAVLAVKNRFLAMGRELAPRLVGLGPHEIKALIDQRVFETLRLLANKEYDQAESD